MPHWGEDFAIFLEREKGLISFYPIGNILPIEAYNKPERILSERRVCDESRSESSLARED